MTASIKTLQSYIEILRAAEEQDRKRIVELVKKSAENTFEIVAVVMYIYHKKPGMVGEKFLRSVLDLIVGEVAPLRHLVRLDAQLAAELEQRRAEFERQIVEVIRKGGTA